MSENKLSDKEKIENILAYFQIKKTDFAQRTGIFPQQVYDMMRGHIAKLSRENMENILDAFPEISPYWLITGEGDMIVGDNNVNVTIANHGNNNNNNVNANVDKLIELSASQQRTIEKLVTLIKE